MSSTTEINHNLAMLRRASFTLIFIGVLNKNTIRTPSVSNEAQRSNNDIDPMTDPDPSSNIVCFGDDNDDALTKVTLPIDYEVPQLTMRMQHYIDDNNISKFNPHKTLRGELLSILFDDVTTSHQLLQVIISNN
ncbi:unnamed protein product [Rotaria socialis]